MKKNIRVCDLCRAEGDLTPAVCSYEGDAGKRFDACWDHKEEVEGFGMETTAYKHEGDITPDELME